MSGLNREKGLEKSDGGALNPEQRSKLRQLKVDVQKLDEKYIRVRREKENILARKYRRNFEKSSDFSLGIALTMLKLTFNL